MGSRAFVLDSNGSASFSGEVNVGSYTGYGWPVAGKSGAHLSENGFLLGNYNGGGKYFQIHNPSNPNDAWINTNIPFVNTVNLLSNSVTVAQFISVVNGNVNSGSVDYAGGVVSLTVSATCDNTFPMDGVSASASVYRNGVTRVGGITTATHSQYTFYDSPGAGTHYYQLRVTGTVGVFPGSGSGSLAILGCKR